MRLRIYLLIGLALVFAFLSGVFILGDEKSHKLEPTEFMTIFDHKKYSKLIEKLSSLQHVIIKGKDEDGVDVFVNYALNITLAEEHTVNQRSLFSESSQLQDISYSLFSKIRSFIIQNIDETPLNQVWVIDSNGPLTQHHGSALKELTASYPNDRVIVIAPEVEIKLSTFKTLNFFRPEDKVVENLLKKEGLTGQQIRLVLQNHKNNLEQLQVSYDQGSLLDHEEAFKAEKAIVTNQLQQAESKILGYLKKLCRYGKLPTKSQISGLDAMQTVGFEQDGYYWFSKNYLLGYESTVSIHCQDPEFFIQTKNIVEQPQEKEQVKTEAVDQTTDNIQTHHEKQNIQQQAQQVKNKKKSKPKRKQKTQLSQGEVQQIQTSEDKVKNKQQSSELRQKPQKSLKKKVKKAVNKQQKPKKAVKKSEQVKKQLKKEVKKIEKPKQQKTTKKVEQKQTKVSQKPIKQVEAVKTKSTKPKQQDKTHKSTTQKTKKSTTNRSTSKSKQNTNNKQKKDQKKKP